MSGNRNIMHVTKVNGGKKEYGQDGKTKDEETLSE